MLAITLIYCSLLKGNLEDSNFIENLFLLIEGKKMFQVAAKYKYTWLYAKYLTLFHIPNICNEFQFLLQNKTAL